MASRMTGYSPEVLTVLAEKQDAKIQALYNKLEELENRIDARERERLQQERNLAVRGLVTLGTIISLLGGIIWSYRSVIFK